MSDALTLKELLSFANKKGKIDEIVKISIENYKKYNREELLPFGLSLLKKEETWIEIEEIIKLINITRINLLAYLPVFKGLYRGEDVSLENMKYYTPLFSNPYLVNPYFVLDVAKVGIKENFIDPSILGKLIFLPETLGVNPMILTKAKKKFFAEPVYLINQIEILSADAVEDLTGKVMPRYLTFCTEAVKGNEDIHLIAGNPEDVNSSGLSFSEHYTGNNEIKSLIDFYLQFIGLFYLRY